VALVGATINAAAFGGWVLSRPTASRSSTDPQLRSARFDDVAAAVFAGVAVIAAVLGSHCVARRCEAVQRGAFGAVAVKRQPLSRCRRHRAERARGE